MKSRIIGLQLAFAMGLVVSGCDRSAEEVAGPSDSPERGVAARAGAVSEPTSSVPEEWRRIHVVNTSVNSPLGYGLYAVNGPVSKLVASIDTKSRDFYYTISGPSLSNDLYSAMTDTLVIRPIVWSSTGGLVVKPVFDNFRQVFARSPLRGNIIRAADGLFAGEGMVSPNNVYGLKMQTDGNLVVYNRLTGTALWSAQRFVLRSRLVMQADGNLVIYSGTTPIWHTVTYGVPGCWLELQDDGNLVIYHYNSSNQKVATWSWMSGKLI